MLAFTKTSEIVNANQQELRDKKYGFVKSEEESKVGGCKTWEDEEGVIYQQLVSPLSVTTSVSEDMLLLASIDDNLDNLHHPHQPSIPAKILRERWKVVVYPSSCTGSNPTAMLRTLPIPYLLRKSEAPPMGRFWRSQKGEELKFFRNSYGRRVALLRDCA